MSRGLVVIALAIVAMSCGGADHLDPAGWSGKGETADGSDTVKLLTFNTALAKVFPYLPERAEEIARQLAAMDADVVCLQEVWEQDVAEQFLDGAGGVLRQAYQGIWRSPEPRKPPKIAGQCYLGHAMNLDSCMKAHCSVLSKFECVSKSGPCERDWNVNDDECKRCLVANADTDPKRCVWAADIGITIFYGADEYYASRRDGLMLLSKLPIEGEVVITQMRCRCLPMRHLTTSGT